MPAKTSLGKAANPTTTASPAFGPLDPATGLPTDKTKAAAFQTAEQKEVLGADFKATGKASTTKAVPIDTTAASQNKSTAEQLDKINQNLTDIKEASNTKVASSNTMKSGYDAYNVRDPLLASLNSGTLDLA